MLRIRGDRTSLLAALACHWAERQLPIPPASPTRQTRRIRADRPPFGTTRRPEA